MTPEPIQSGTPTPEPSAGAADGLPDIRQALFTNGGGDAKSENLFQAYVEEAFTYHPATPEQAERYQQINNAAKLFALTILRNCPASPDRTDAIRQVRAARMTANASIATRGRA